MAILQTEQFLEIDINNLKLISSGMFPNLG